MSAFSYLTGTALLSETLATPLSAALMRISPWIPFWLSTAVLALGIVLACFLPETRRKESSSDLPEQKRSSSNSMPLSLRCREMIHTVTHDERIIMLLYVFLVAALSRQVLPLFIFYGSNKFEWSISQVSISSSSVKSCILNFAKSSLLIAFRAAVNLLLLWVLLPAASTLLTLYKVQGIAKDLRVSQVSGTLSAVGSAIIFLAPFPAVAICGIATMALGSAFHLAARSLITSLSLPQHVATVYSIISFVISLGTLLAGPLLAKVLQVGMHIGKEWSGFPFGLVSLLYTTALCAVCCIRLDPVVSVKRIEHDEA